MQLAVEFAHGVLHFTHGLLAAGGGVFGFGQLGVDIDLLGQAEHLHVVFIVQAERGSTSMRTTLANRVRSTTRTEPRPPMTMNHHPEINKLPVFASD